MKLADSLEVVMLRACITFFLSSKVFRRSLSCSTMSNRLGLTNQRTNLGLLLKVERVHSLQLSFLTGDKLGEHHRWSALQTLLV